MRIDFPSDQPVTSDLSSVSGINLFSTVSINTRSVASNYLEIDGCPIYQNYPALGVVYLDKVLNAGQVKTTNTFKYTLYAVSGGQTYNIA